MPGRGGSDWSGWPGPGGGLTRREFLKAAVGTGVAVALPGCPLPLDLFAYSDNAMTAAAAILRAAYDADLVGVIEAGFGLVAPPDVTNKRVMLKINLVDHPRGKPAVTDPALVIAAAEAFRRRGAAEVVIADGPALERDAWQIVDEAGLTPLLNQHGLRFIDLNTAEMVKQPNIFGASGLSDFFCAAPAWDADVLVSVPKMKAHHWAGASLAMKNLFGVISGVAHGMPRNDLHLVDFHSAVLDINSTRPADYAIIDGVVGMEGDGPVRGTPIDVNVVVMGSNLPAVDATAARVMGIRPERIDYLRRAAGILGPIGESSIEQRGENIGAVRTPFDLLAHQAYLAL